METHCRHAIDTIAKLSAHLSKSNKDLLDTIVKLRIHKRVLHMY